MNRPATLAEARRYRYGTWAGNPHGNPYREGFCIAEVFPGGRAALHHQCGNRVQKSTPWCDVHRPGAKEARAAKRPPTRYEREMGAIDRREKDMRRYRRCERALKAIAKTNYACHCAEIARKALRGGTKR